MASPVHCARWAVLKTIGSISDSIGLDGFGAKACGAARALPLRLIFSQEQLEFEMDNRHALAASNRGDGLLTLTERFLLIFEDW
jgi:hypothetical protein